MSFLPGGYDRWRTREPEDHSHRLATWDLAVIVKIHTQCSENDLEHTCDAIETEIQKVLTAATLSGTVKLVICEEADFVDFVEDYGRDK